MAAAALLRQAGALGADGVRKGGGDYLVFVRKAGVPVPVEVPVHGTVADLRAAAELGAVSGLSYQGEALRDADSLADRGIGPQAVVEALEVPTPQSERHLIVAGAGLEEVNGAYELIGATNGGTCWRKCDDKEMTIHWYWGPTVNGKCINGWLLGRKEYVVTDLAYALPVAQVPPTGALQLEPPSEIERAIRYLPGQSGWVTATEYGGLGAIGVDPPPTLFGALVLSQEEREEAEGATGASE
eukprot:TRINITY_DN9140_c0_g1_i5.p1 TRINITY_DN9140_c0_g1~~TRINITY_DN9140_c0_g1_i5.p1  ORF type:complete len:260 (+),score=76.46 TRINITY_DN9140_c0_g1_i5:57-782(+)